MAVAVAVAVGIGIRDWYWHEALGMRHWYWNQVLLLALGMRREALIQIRFVAIHP